LTSYDEDEVGCAYLRNVSNKLLDFELHYQWFFKKHQKNL